MPQFDSGAAKQIGRFSEGLLLRLLQFKTQGDVAPKRPGGDRKSGHIEAGADFLLGAVAKTPDVTLVELQEKLKARGVSAGIGTLWRFFDRRRFTFKKKTAHAAEQQRDDVKAAARHGSRDNSISIQRG
jgi:transposase